MASDSRIRLAGWTSGERRDIYMRAYRTAQELWGAPVDDLEIPTRFGTTHALVSGPVGGAFVLVAFGVQHGGDSVVSQCRSPFWETASGGPRFRRCAGVERSDCSDP